MDMLTLAQAKKFAKSLCDALDLQVEGLADDVEGLDSDLIIVNEDGDVASKLIVNALRQHIWKSESEAYVCEKGEVTLTNTQKFPFNNSRATVALQKTQKDLNYVVVAEVTTVAGNIGEVSVTDKQVNGFKIGFSGGAKSVAVKFYVIGGFLK